MTLPTPPDAALPLAKALNVIATFGDPARALAAFCEHVVATGGTVVLPEAGNSWAATGPTSAVLSLHGVTGMGEDGAEALADWTRAARRTIEASDTIRAAEAEVLAPTGDAAALRRACDLVGIFSRNDRARLAVAALQQATRQGYLPAA